MRSTHYLFFVLAVFGVSTTCLACASSLCGINLPNGLSNVRQGVEKHYGRQIQCRIGGPKSTLDPQIGPVLFLPNELSEFRDASAYHELMHMQLWTEGFPRDRSGCGSSPFQFDPRELENLCFSLRELLLHRIINSRLASYGLLPIEQRQAAIENKHAADSILDERNQNRLHGKYYSDVRLDIRAVELLKSEYETPDGYRPYLDAYKTLHFEKAIELAEKLKKIIDSKNPQTPSGVLRTIDDCVSLIGRDGYAGKTRISE